MIGVEAPCRTDVRRSRTRPSPTCSVRVSDRADPCSINASNTSLTASLMSSISSSVHFAVDAMPLAVSLIAETRSASAGRRISIGPNRAAAVDQCCSAVLIALSPRGRNCSVVPVMSSIRRTAEPTFLRWTDGAALTRPAAGTEQRPQAGRIDEIDIAEVEHDRCIVLTCQDAGLERRSAGDVDVAVHHQHAGSVEVDLEWSTALVSHGVLPADGGGSDVNTSGCAHERCGTPGRTTSNVSPSPWRQEASSGSSSDGKARWPPMAAAAVASAAPTCTARRALGVVPCRRSHHE